MRILAFDTTGPIVTVGAASGGRALGRWDTPAQRPRGNLLAECIDRALADLGWSRATVEGLALVTGPGSLTATRIGWATAAGWAQATGILIAGWPTPRVQYRRWVERRMGGMPPLAVAETAFCVVHHRGDRFYCYHFSPDMPPGAPTEITLGCWSPAGSGRIELIGPGVPSYRERWQQSLAPSIQLVDDTEAVVGGDRLAIWGEEDLVAGRCFSLDQSPLDYGLPPDFRRTVRAGT
jgi:tRNA threonylcarbamoyl adenosine modification protein YeaZ